MNFYPSVKSIMGMISVSWTKDFGICHRMRCTHRYLRYECTVLNSSCLVEKTRQLFT
jgi:hypothetical protein